MAYTLQFDWLADVVKDQLKGPDRVDFDAALQMLRDGSFATSSFV